MVCRGARGGRFDLQVISECPNPHLEAFSASDSRTSDCSLQKNGFKAVLMEFAVLSCLPSAAVLNTYKMEATALGNGIIYNQNTHSRPPWSQVLQLRIPFPTQSQLKPCVTSPIRYCQVHGARECPAGYWCPLYGLVWPGPPEPTLVNNKCILDRRHARMLNFTSLFSLSPG